MIGLCLADFMYLANLTLVAAAQLNNKSWIFGPMMCTFYHGTETTGKYASVIFVVLLAADRYCAMCRPNLCARYRNYRTAISSSTIAWCLAFSAAIPLYLYSEIVELRIHGSSDLTKPVCIAKWPSSISARWYITFSSILIYVLPLVLMSYFNYHILKRLREALRGSRRMRRASKSRAPYHRVTRLVLWVVIFHAACWSPFWLFNLLSSVFRLRIHTRLDRFVINVIHLLPYINCALNPLLYATHAENFRTAFRSLFVGGSTKRLLAKRSFSQLGTHKRLLGNSMDPSLIVSPFLHRLVEKKQQRYARCNDRSHSVIANRSLRRPPKRELILAECVNSDVTDQSQPQNIIIYRSASPEPSHILNRSYNKNYLLPWSYVGEPSSERLLPDEETSQSPSTAQGEKCDDSNSATMATVVFMCDNDSML